MQKNIYLIITIIFLFFWFVNSEFILFQNSELLINIILFLLLIFLSIFFNFYSFYNLLYYNTYSNKKDHLVTMVLIISLIKRYNLYSYKNRIYMIYLLNHMIVLLNRYIIQIIHKIYLLFVLNICKYSEARLFFMFYSSIPSFSADVSKISILSYLNY